MIQEYYVTLTEEARESARPAQFVYTDNASDLIAGFISEVDLDNNRMRLTLFEPCEESEYMIDSVEELSMEDIRLRLVESLKANPDMMDSWNEIIKNSIS